MFNLWKFIFYSFLKDVILLLNSLIVLLLNRAVLPFNLSHLSRRMMHIFFLRFLIVVSVSNLCVSCRDFSLSYL